MKTTHYLLSTLLATTLLPACGLFEDDQPPSDSGDTDGNDGVNTCEDQFNGFDPALLQGVCPSPYAPQYTAFLGGADILWIDDPANATTIGPGGWVFGNTAQADWLGWISQGDQQCGIACTLPQGHPCFGGDTFCFGGPAESQCTFCGGGDYTPEQCGDFIESCWGPDGGNGDDTGAADSTSGGSAGDVTGAADSTAGVGAGQTPDDSIFTSNPDVIFGTTQAVLDLFGDAAPPNLVAEDICAVWDPQAAVSDWFGDAILQKEVLQQILDNAEMTLGYCDHLKLELVDNGVRLLSFDPRGLPNELGFEKDDIILSLNGAAATNPLALQEQVIWISNNTPQDAVVQYERGGKTYTRKIRVE